MITEQDETSSHLPRKYWGHGSIQRAILHFFHYNTTIVHSGVSGVNPTNGDLDLSRRVQALRRRRFIHGHRTIQIALHDAVL